MKMTPYRLTGSGTTRKCDFVGVGVNLLKEMCHRGWTLRFHILKRGPVSFSSCCLRIQMLILQYHVCLHVAMMATS